MNGLVWVGLDKQVNLEAAGKDAIRKAHEQVARVANSIQLLARLNFPITPAKILEVYQVRPEQTGNLSFKKGCQGWKEGYIVSGGVLCRRA